MNNRQAGLIAAASLLSGSVGVSPTTVYGRAAEFAAHLDEQDKLAQERATEEDRQRYLRQFPELSRGEELTIHVSNNRSGEPKSVEQIAEENGRGSFERLTARQAPEGKPLDPTPWRDVTDRDWRGSNRLEVAHPVWAPRSSFEQDIDKYPKEQK